MIDFACHVLLGRSAFTVDFSLQFIILLRDDDFLVETAVNFDLLLFFRNNCTVNVKIQHCCSVIMCRNYLQIRVDQN